MNATPQLQAPGAGVPALDRFLGRPLITSLARFASRERLLAKFRRSAEQLLDLARSVDIGSLEPDPGTGPDVIEEFERTVCDFDRRVRAT